MRVSSFVVVGWVHCFGVGVQAQRLPSPEWDGQVQWGFVLVADWSQAAGSVSVCFHRYLVFVGA